MLKIKCKFLRSHRKQSYKKLFWLWLFDIGATNSQALSVALQPLLEGRGGVIVLQGCCEPVQPGCTGRVLFCSSERSFGTQRADFLLSLKSFTKTLQMVYIDTGYFSAKLLTQMRRPSSTSAITDSMKSMFLVVLGFSSLSCPWCPSVFDEVVNLAERHTLSRVCNLRSLSDLCDGHAGPGEVTHKVVDPCHPDFVEKVFGLNNCVWTM